MTADLERAAMNASLLLERLEMRPSGFAVAAIAGDNTDIQISSRDDTITPETVFETGSLTKSMIGILLADAIGRGETAIEANLGDLLGVTGAAGEVTLQQLATHRSGLPRVPAALVVDAADPYAGYTETDLLAELQTAGLGPREFAYSNLGYMILGLVLGKVAGVSLGELLQQRLLAPLGMTSSSLDVPKPQRLPGYSGASNVPWWSNPLPGAGGACSTIADLSIYLRAQLSPPADSLGRAIEMAATAHSQGAPICGLGWFCDDDIWWCNGGTGGFRSFIGFHRGSQSAVALLANNFYADSLDSVGFSTLAEMSA